MIMDKPTDRRYQRAVGALIVIGVVAVGAMVCLKSSLREPDNPLLQATEFELPCPAAWDLDFSPDGRYLAISEAPDNLGGDSTTAVYGINERRYVLEGAPGGWNCAWSCDGNELAIASNTTPEIVVRDTRSWTTTRAYTIPWKDIAPDALRGSPVGSLSLDKSGNIYAAIEDVIVRDEGNWNPAIVWWNTPDGPSKKYEMFAKCDRSDVSSVSVSRDEAEPRVAVSYENWSRTCDVQILRLRRKASGMWAFELEYTVPCAGEAYVVLSPDGRNLAVSDRRGLSWYRLSDQRAEIVFSLENEGLKDSKPDEPTTFGLPYGPVVDISRDGRFVVFGRGGSKVVRVADGAVVFRVDKFALTRALSPDGKFLAVAFQDAKRIYVYRIPQNEGKKSENLQKGDGEN